MKFLNKNYVFWQWKFCGFSTIILVFWIFFFFYFVFKKIFGKNNKILRIIKIMKLNNIVELKYVIHIDLFFSYKYFKFKEI